MLGGADEDRMGSFPVVMVTEGCAKWCKGGEEWDPKSVIGDLNKQRVEGRTQVGKGTRVYGILVVFYCGRAGRRASALVRRVLAEF